MRVGPIWVVCAIYFGLAAAPIRAADYAVDVRSAQHSMREADRADGIRRLLSPNAPAPKIGPHETELAYVRWAKNALSRGQGGEAELALEWAQLRNRVDEEEAAYEAGLPPPPYDGQCERTLCKALRAIGSGNGSESMALMDVALREFEQRGNNSIKTATC